MTSDTAAGKVYNTLVERNDKIITTKDIKETAKLLKVDYSAAFVGLNRWAVLVPAVFKGVYYLKNREERDLGTIKEEPLSIVASACNLKLGENWYFGLATALQLSGLWDQQTLTSITVISKKRVYGPKPKVAGMGVEFKQLAKVPFKPHVRKRGKMRFSDPSRTILDYAYYARSEGAQRHARTIFASVSEKVGGTQKLISDAKPLISKYPNLYSIFLKNFFEART